ncbi:DUF1523 family protein [Sulfitobacter sp. D35]|uniref:DUF1523 family protein n=1 Tax=Sulfitobacter sp. D35 TaxID=3083252 RepID=UPI00296F6D92|nr:DUF1523 family protein [Sulfitobacter sp. D35]MDW4498987.1 DUF1523 family protein [Sulfitobacter sp. D35]
MVYVKWTLILMFWALIGAFFHYTLPHVDIVRVTDTYERRIDFGENSLFWGSGDVGSASGATSRDVFFIQTRLAGGDVMVYRNEDTGWGWPPYFKFDTSNLQAEAADVRSTSANPRYVALKHYGWRNEFFSIFPNAVSIRPVDGPDASKGIPWVNILVLTVFFAIVWAIWARWRRFRQNRIDPTLEDWQDSWEAAGDRMDERRGRLRRWWDERRAR